MTGSLFRVVVNTWEFYYRRFSELQCVVCSITYCTVFSLESLFFIFLEKCIRID